jgi:RNA polymerase sigma-70 factor (ECF subfamily)
MSHSLPPPPDAADPFEAFFRDHYARLCAFVHGYVRSRDVAQDIVQDVFLALWQKQVDTGATEITPAYAYAAARNRALKHLRHARVEQRFQERSAPPGGAPGGADHAVRHRETAEAVEAAVAELPDRCREIFILSRRQHMSYSEIAAALGISVKTVEVQMWRALRRLRGRLARYLPVAAVAMVSSPLLPFR